MTTHTDGLPELQRLIREYGTLCYSVAVMRERGQEGGKTNTEPYLKAIEEALAAFRAEGIRIATQRLREELEAAKVDVQRIKRWMAARAYKDGETLSVEILVLDDVAVGDFGEAISDTIDAAISKESDK